MKNEGKYRLAWHRIPKRDISGHGKPLTFEYLNNLTATDLQANKKFKGEIYHYVEMFRDGRWVELG